MLLRKEVAKSVVLSEEDHMENEEARLLVGAVVAGEVEARRIARHRVVTVQSTPHAVRGQSASVVQQLSTAHGPQGLRPTRRVAVDVRRVDERRVEVHVLPAALLVRFSDKVGASEAHGDVSVVVGVEPEVARRHSNGKVAVEVQVAERIDEGDVVGNELPPVIGESVEATAAGHRDSLVEYLVADESGRGPVAACWLRDAVSKECGVLAPKDTLGTPRRVGFVVPRAVERVGLERNTLQYCHCLVKVTAVTCRDVSWSCLGGILENSSVTNVLALQLALLPLFTQW
mmetsp:Transcript_10667/g.43738  ORF Transcript_10667/g.43738 Transcript_10667/m.43738 type:complete len:287 (+) Transcript_10667:955-1815(+)